MSVTVETFTSAQEAARALAGGNAQVIGGGTIVMRGVNAGAVQGRLIRITDPAMAEIRPMGDAVLVGALATMDDVLANRDLAFLHAVARQVGGPQIRAMATVGGNLFAAHPYGDCAVALLALGARAQMAGGGERALADLLRDRNRAGLVAGVLVPRPRDPRAFAFRKVSRIKPKGVSVVSIAAHLPREGGRIRGARVAFGGMAPQPMPANAVERALEGQALDAATIRRAVQVAAEGFDPPTDALATGWYRREVIGVHLGRLLETMERG
jgi:CO/xanthine dehydrogenase FAD-binding subunit